MPPYEVRCECGKAIAVEVKQAGTIVTCSCGEPVRIPSMSTLRVAAGETPMPLNVVEQIRLMNIEGRLPENASCPITGQPVDDTIWLHVQCERTEIRVARIGFWTRVFLAIVCRVILLSDSYGPGTVHGRDTFVEVPLGINHTARRSMVAERDQSALKKALSCTSIYSQLLREYPAAEIVVIDRA